MFINGSRGHNRDGQQTAKGDFLMIFAKGQELRGVVRHVRMSQLGHFMMASVKIGKYKRTLSGTYGSDGLPMETTKDVPRKKWQRIGETEEWYESIYDYEEEPNIAWETLVPLPLELQEEFWHPEYQGWNSAGSEAINVRKWAVSNLVALKKAGK